MVRKGTSEEVVRVHTLRAAKFSPFDRWEPTWTGPRRRTPELRVLLIEDPSRSRTLMDVDAGAVRNGEPARRLWETTVLEALEVGTRAQLARRS